LPGIAFPLENQGAFQQGSVVPSQAVMTQSSVPQDAGRHLRDIERMLAARTKELAAAKRRIQRSLVRREVMEVAFEQRAKLHRKCLAESLQLQKRLRQLTHRLLAAQEAERKKVSRELENEIAQTLVAVNVRLLALKHEAWRQIEGFKEKIASTRQVVVESVRTVRHVARKVQKV
jgi:signal transduction histidine kinase